MKKVVLLVLVLFSLGVANAQIVPVDGEKFRVLTDFKGSRPFGKDTVLGISVTADTSGGLLIRTKQDTTAMYLHNDTAKMFTTASSWKFTPELPCCVPDTIPLNFITTQCTTVTANKWRPVLTDSLGRASTTACDTISYLYVDTFFAGNLDTCFFKLGTGANSLMDKRSTSAGSINTTVIGVANTIDSTSDESGILGNFNENYDNSYRCMLVGISNSIYQDSYESSIFGYTNLIINNSYRSTISGLNNTIDNSNQSFALGSNISITNTPKTIALGIYATPTDSNQLAISDSIKTVLLKLNVATAGSGSVLTVDSNGIATWDNQTLSGSATLDFGSIGAHAYEDLTITVTGATSGDVVSLGLPNGSVPADASFFAWVSATDTVTVRCFNIDGGTVDPASGLFKVKVFK